ncbi:MAG: ZIP family metal transporter [Ignisphaera sp.]
MYLDSVSEPILLVLINGSIVMGATSLGSLTAFFGYKLSDRYLDLSLGFAAGIMIVASFSSLIMPAIEEGLYIDVGLGIALGILLILLLDKVLPHEHESVGYEGLERFREKIRKAWLVALAMIIHNIPEGLAVGVATIYSPYLGLATAIAIGLQDVVEGMATSLPLASAEGKRLKAVAIGIMSGVIELLATFGGAALATLSRIFLGIGMGLAAGAMIYVVVEEILPEIFHRQARNRRIATLGFIIGFYAMLYLDILIH